MARDREFFVIFSLSRCGSTALHRALCSHVDITCAFEPDFSATAWQETELRSLVEAIRHRYAGMKHVWDPSGFPFVEDHRSVLGNLSADVERVVRMNRVLLDEAGGKVVFLRRRNHLARVVSDLLGQQTELWGPATPDGHAQPGVDEPMLYRQALSSRQIRSLDIDIVDWYMTHVPDMETRLRSMVRGADCFDLAYEDMFGPELSIDQRVAKFAEVLEFLGFASAYGSWDRATVEYLLSPDRRLNRQDTLARIPNVAAIASRYPEYRLT